MLKDHLALTGATDQISSAADNRRTLSETLTGTVEQVWEDGFRFNAGGRILQVDAYDLYGDFTANYVATGDQLTVVGEFEGGEFDALSIARNSLPVTNAPNNPLPVISSNNRDGGDFFGNNLDNVIRGTNRDDDIRGGGGNDRLFGLGGDDDLFGDAGNDLLVGGSGGDDLFGGTGNDRLSGGNGGDDLQGGAGRDVLIGGGGRDTFVLETNGNDIIRDFQNGVDELGLAGGLAFNNLVLQQRGNNTVIFANGDRVAKLLGVEANSITTADLD